MLYQYLEQWTKYSIYAIVAGKRVLIGLNQRSDTRFRSEHSINILTLSYWYSDEIKTACLPLDSNMVFCRKKKVSP
jgi:hypothetical protein